MTRNADNRTTELLQVGDILLNEPVNERIVVVDADAVSVWLRKVEKNDELLVYEGNVWAKLGIKHGNKNRCSQHYAQTVFEFDGHVQQAIAATLGSDRDEIYNAGFDSGIKATLQQLDGLIVSGYDIKAICAWIDEQWKRYES